MNLTENEDIDYKEKYEEMKRRLAAADSLRITKDRENQKNLELIAYTAAFLIGALYYIFVASADVYELKEPGISMFTLCLNAIMSLATSLFLGALAVGIFVVIYGCLYNYFIDNDRNIKIAFVAGCLILILFTIM